MKNLKVRKSILLVILFVIVVGVTSNVFATGTTTINPIQIPTINTAANVAVNDTVANNTVSPVVNTAVENVTASTYTNTNLPQTGDASDYAIFALIAVCIVAAIYAYKKVRDYNIK